MEALTFGQRIADFRGKKGFTQRELAKRVGITPTALNYYEKDKREPNVQTIIKIIDVLEISSEQLLNINHTKNNPTAQSEQPDSKDKERLINELAETLSKKDPETIKAFLVLMTQLADSPDK